MALGTCERCGAANSEFNVACARCGAPLTHAGGTSGTLRIEEERLLGEVLAARYRLDAVLGRGGMGVVYRALDTTCGEDVALKLLSLQLVDDPRSRLRFVREATAARALVHPNIAAIRGWGEHGGRPFFVMTFYEGETLRDRLRRGALPAREVVRVLDCVAAALEVAHAVGVVHRDIKPANVLLTTNGEVKLLDFGLARLATLHPDADPLTSADEIVGTPEYMAPEQRLTARVDPRADLWAVGVLAHEMLSGENPFWRGTTKLSADELRDRRAKAAGPDRLYRELEHIAAKLLSKRPVDRYQSAAELLLALGGLRKSDAGTPHPAFDGAEGAAPAPRVAPRGSVRPRSRPPTAIGLQPGTVVGRYVVVQTLGRGGMGAVVLAYDTQLARRVALKILLTRVASEEARVRMLREAQAMAQLSHPNVVDIYDVGTHEGNIFLAMRYVEGVTLNEWLAAPRSRRDVLRVLKQAGAGLAAAHSAGIVHRDFKPDNVLVTKAGHPWVLDFGIARSAGSNGASPRPHAAPVFPPGELSEALTAVSDRLTETGTILGTVGYFAPETALEQRADARSDVYSFCVTAWRCLFGSPPFPSGSVHEYVEAISAGPPAIPKDATVPAWLAEIVRKGLQTDADLRPASMADLLREIEEAEPESERDAVPATRRGVVAFELTFRSNVELVPIVRRFVSDFYDRVIRDADATSRIALATHELLENAVKFARSEETRLLVEVDRARDPPSLAVRTWNTAGDEDIAMVEDAIAAMAAPNDPSAYYYEQMK